MKLLKWKYLSYAAACVLMAAYVLIQLIRMDFRPPDWADLAAKLIPGALLIGFGALASVSDLRDKRVSNGLVLAMLGAWVVVMMPRLFLNTRDAIPELLDSLLGFAVSGVLMLLVYLVSRKGMGGADVKFMAAAGLYLGLRSSLTTLLIGSVLAALACSILILLKKLKRQDSIPLIPFLYLGILFALYTR